MPILPRTDLGKLEFFEAHLPVWGTAPATIGLTAGQVTSLSTATTAARTAFNAAIASHEASKASTVNQHNKIDAMNAIGTDLLKIIKAYAAVQNDPNVYVLAQIPPPGEPTPAPPPSAPTDLAAVMNTNGSIELRWKGSLAQRQFYSVWRQNEVGGVYDQIGSVASKVFLDATCPRGVSQVSYEVRGHRDSQVSVPCTALVIYFGAVAGGGEGTQAMVNGQVIGTIGNDAPVSEAA